MYFLSLHNTVANGLVLACFKNSILAGMPLFHRKENIHTIHVSHLVVTNMTVNGAKGPWKASLFLKSLTYTTNIDNSIISCFSRSLTRSWRVAS